MPRNGKEKDIYKEWLRKAEEDELSINAILIGEGAPSTACFLSQQMAENYLKCLLIYYGKAFPKTHDLLQLASLLKHVEPDMFDLHDELKLLNRYYIETRYPGDYPVFTKSESRQAFEAALKVKSFVVKKFYS